MEEHSISIIVPLYNEGAGAGQMLDHLLAVAPGRQVIVVDASDELASMAAMAELSQSISGRDCFRIVEAQRAGRASQMNQGAAMATGNILLFLHCDTRLNPKSLDQIENAVGSGSRWGRFDIRLDAHGGIYRIIEFMMFLRSRLRRLATGDQGMFMESALFKEVGGFPDIALMEDVALSRKLSRYRPVVIGEAITTSARRWQNRGPVRTIILMWKLRLMFWLGVSPTKLNQLYGDER